MPVFAPLARPSYDPFGPLSGYDRNIRLPNQGEPVRSRLASSVYPVLDVCMDAYYASLSRSFQGDIEFSHHVEVGGHRATFIMKFRIRGFYDSHVRLWCRDVWKGLSKWARHKGQELPPLQCR